MAWIPDELASLIREITKRTDQKIINGVVLAFMATGVLRGLSTDGIPPIINEPIEIAAGLSVVGGFGAALRGCFPSNSQGKRGKTQNSKRGNRGNPENKSESEPDDEDGLREDKLKKTND